MPIESAITLSDNDRAILRALFSRVPELGSAATEPRSEPADALASALTAAGLDALDLPLWFAQPHIQRYIAAKRDLDDFLDEQSTRAARREGLELLRTLPALTHAQHSASAASGPGSDPPDPRADASPSEPASARSLREMRLIATALLRAPLPTPVRRQSTKSRIPAEPAIAPWISSPTHGQNVPAHDPRPRQNKVRDVTPDPDEALAGLGELLPDGMSDPSLDEILRWAVSALTESGPAIDGRPPPDTS